MAVELAKMGADIHDTDDGLIINGKDELTGAETDSRSDHRVAMSLAIAALKAKGATEINGCECVDISFPGFYNYKELFG